MAKNKKINLGSATNMVGFSEANVVVSNKELEEARRKLNRYIAVRDYIVTVKNNCLSAQDNIDDVYLKIGDAFVINGVAVRKKPISNFKNKIDATVADLDKISTAIDDFIAQLQQIIGQS